MQETRRAHRRELSRRRLLLATGSGATVLLSGCTGDADEDEESSENLEDAFQGTDERTEEPDDTPDRTDVSQTDPPRNPDRGPDLSELEGTIHETVNEVRMANGVGLLEWDEELHAIARAHSEDMIRREFFDHEDPMRNDWDDRYKAAGYQCIVDVPGGYRSGGEAIARVSYPQPPGMDDIADDVITQFRELPSNSAPLAPYWDSHGIGAAFDSRANVPTLYITQNFC